jgi:hypothetical protein
MTCIRFDFTAETPEEKQDAFLSSINKSDSVREARRLKENTRDKESYRQCYLELKPKQAEIEMTARNMVASLRAKPFIKTAFVVEEGWPVSD